MSAKATVDSIAASENAGQISQATKDTIKGILACLAAGKKTVTYGDLSKIIQDACGRFIHPFNGFNAHLEKILNLCAQCNLPCLSALIVTQNQVPGPGFLVYYRQRHPDDTRSDEQILEQEQQACQNNADWSTLLKLCNISPDELWRLDKKEKLPLSVIFKASALAYLLDHYERKLEHYRPEELYKWEALAHFQTHWNLDAADFPAMLREALSKTNNLLVSSYYYAKGMLEIIADHNPEGVRASFKMLLDNNLALDQRMRQFAADMDTYLVSLNAERAKHGEEAADNHYQDVHAMSVYLALAQNDTHYIYKTRPYESFAAQIGAQVPKGKYEKVMAFEDLSNAVLEYLLAHRKSLVEKSDALLPENLRAADASHHMLAQDVIYVIVKDHVKHWSFSPGEQAKFWQDCKDEGIMGIGWEALGDLSRFKTKSQVKEALISAYDASNPKNDTESIWCFINSIKPGDVVWARRGSKHVLGYGVVESDYRYEEGRKPYASVRDVRWFDVEEFDVEKTFPQKAISELTENTAVTISELNSQAQPQTNSGNAKQQTENEGQSPTAQSQQSYWWLNASPKIWSYSDFEPGEEQTYTIYTEHGTPRRILSNFKAAKQGDLIVGYEATPTKKILALCEVSRDSDDKYLYFRKVKDFAEPVPYSVIKEDDVLSQSQFMRNPNGSLFALSSEEFKRIIDLTSDSAPITSAHQAKPYSDEQFLDDVYVSEADLASMKRLLLRKKNLILQGAPGTGKTYCAKRLAWAFMGEQADNRICFVQFHQNSSYDDMMAGYRPAEDGGFQAIPGEFLRFCDKAAQDPDQRPWFFIIDEINRANVSKVFGEMLMLIEAGHRDESIKLSLLGRSVKVPSNLYIIGMMNTADRGLALIDYALRRRFAFFEMPPAFNNPQFSAYLSSTSNPALQALAQAVDHLNREIADDPSFGSGFRIGHSYFCLGEHVSNEDVADIIDFELEPLIREYWFDAPDTAENKIADLRAVL